MILSKGLGRIPVYLYQPETVLYLAAVNSTAGTISTRSLQHVDKFVRDCKEAGVWGKLIEVGVFAGDQLAAAQTKVKYATLPYYTSVNFVSGDYSEATGLLGDGATKYLNTNFDGSTIPATCHVSAYLREDPVSTIQYWMGTNDGGGTQFLFLGTQAPDSVTRLGGTTQATLAGATTRGFYYGERAANNDLKLYKNNAPIASSATVTTLSLPAQNVYAFARNAGGTPTSYTATRLSFLSVGQNLSAQERTDYYNAVQTLQVNLGRAV